MLNNLKIFLPLLLLIFSCKKEETVFTEILSSKSNIDFSNNITMNDTLNVLNFEYVFNGGGVALGDFNNDKLLDVYFTGNQVENQLYLNKGDFNFENISKISKTTGNGKWCTGASVVDINNDNLLDIYVCASVKKSENELANLLYVNQGMDKNGIPIFKEMAKEYGIDDTSHTTNASFFDYDNDGDLDLYLLVNEMEKVRFPNKYAPKIVDGSSKRTDKLYRNNGPITQPGGGFTDVSKQTGILIEGYGLGVNIADVNSDGWKDIYVANDYLSNDILYINNRNGTFTDQASKYFKHTSASAMGTDIQDINNDGLVDIFTLDMLPEGNFQKKMQIPANNYAVYLLNEMHKYDFQYTRNTLQLNQGIDPKNGLPVFSEVGIQAGIAATGWSWCPMIADFDNDGQKDLIVTNGFPKDITDLDYISYKKQPNFNSNYKQLMDSIPEAKIANYAFKNNGNIDFENVSEKWGINAKTFSNGAAYGDFDNDGDLDYIVNNINDKASVFRNNSTSLSAENSNYITLNLKGNEQNKNGIGASIELLYNENDKQVYENNPYRGYLSTIENKPHFGLGKTKIIDKITVKWQSGLISEFNNIKTNQVFTIDEKNAKAILPKSIISKTVLTDVSQDLNSGYVHLDDDVIDFNIQKLLPHKLSQYGPAMAVGDVNGDGIDDVFIGGTNNHKGTFLLQSKSGKFIKNDLIADETDDTKLFEDAGALLFDADNDADLDLYLVSAGNNFPPASPYYQDRFYENNGSGNFKQNMTALPQFIKNGSAIKAVDFDHDGDLDLFVGGRSIPGYYPKPVNSYLLRNDSNKSTKFTDITSQIAPQLVNIGMISDAIWSDFDNDGWEDLVLAGEWMPITILKNMGGKKLEKIACETLESEVGFWNSITAGDFDNDGDIDYVAGNYGENNFYKATNATPTGIYGKDFNGDDFYDAVPTYYTKNKDGKNKEVTYNGRDDLLKQMNNFRIQYTNYKTFANSIFDQLFTPEELGGAIALKANNLKTSYFENLGKGKFELKPLAWQAQSAPIYGINAEDINNDGNLDLLLVGNDYGNEVYAGKMDAFNGLMLAGDGKGNFKPTSINLSGFYVPGDAKALVKLLDSNNNAIYFSSQNKGDIRSFKISEIIKNIKLFNDDKVVNINLKNGKTRKQEVYFGSSFYSQSTNTILISKAIKSIEITNKTGKKRNLTY